MKLLASIFCVAFLQQCSGRQLGSRIVGGMLAIPGEFPFAAAIDVETSNSRFYCGGALLNRDWVITSANCVNDGILFTIRLGSSYLEDQGIHVFATSVYHVPQDFNPATIEGDIGLIKFRISIDYSDYIRPIYLPESPLQDQTTAYIMGWGLTADNDSRPNILRYIDGTVLPQTSCRAYYGNQIKDNMACVAGRNNAGTCTGDNGGPLVLYTGTEALIVGVASFISGNGCETSEPSGYTRIYPYLSWIREQANSSAL